MDDSTDDASEFDRLLGIRGDHHSSWHEHLGVPKIVIVPEWPDYPDEADFEAIDWVLFELESIVSHIGNCDVKIDDPESFSCSLYMLSGEALDLTGYEFGVAGIAIANYEHLHRELLRLIDKVESFGIDDKLWMSPKLLTRMVTDRFDSAFDAMSMLSLGNPSAEIIERLERRRKAAHAGLDAFLAPFVMSLRMAVEDLEEEAKTGPAPPSEDLDRLRKAIADTIHPDGRQAGAKVVVKRAGGAASPMYAALKYLEARGEYNGRLKPPRDKSKR